jgi:YYY domain-containing protein
MSEAFRWWLILQLVGIPLLPLCLALFRRLPDRGYALSKPFGLIFLGYTFWLLNSLHILPNSGRGILAALALLAAISAVFVYRERDELLEWISAHWQYILGVEVLFLIVFAVAVWLRSMVGNISGTEQPMDLMFINAATRADHFPPKDPWLSGHTVAYYYFGYLMVAMTGRLAAVDTEIGYNIGLAMIAAMALVGAAGIVYNLVAMRESAAATAPDAPKSRSVLPFNWRPPVFGLAGGLMLVIMGNLVWVFQFMSAYGIGGKGFYDWVDVSGLKAGSARHSWYPSDFFAFFDASRIYRLDDKDFRAITEFPMFSFLLGDLHPHVMALPFVLLVVGMALALFRSREPLDITFWLQRPLALVAVAILVGGLAFLNTWDIATMAFVVVAAAFVSNFTRVRTITGDLFVQAVSFALPLLVLAIVMYLPFYTSFTSQADGIGAVVSNRGITVPATRPFHLFLFWGPLFVVVVPFVLARLLPLRARVTRTMAAIAAAPAVAVVIGWVLVYGFEQMTDSKKLGDSPGDLFAQIGDRGSAWLTAIFLGAVLAAALLALWLELTADGAGGEGASIRADAGGASPAPTRVVPGRGFGEREGVLFVLTLVCTALLLILGTEFFYVGDVFNSRMNTVFKLYYQAWMLLAIAGGFSLYYLASWWRATFPRERQYRLVWAGAVVLVLAGAALYPLGGTMNRTYKADGELRGLSYFPADEREAIAWLNDRAQGQDLVIAEAVGNDYSLASRISAATGVPAILGWGGHEDQWRGGSAAARAGRFEDVNTLYTTTDTNAMNQILKKYNVTYVYVGPLERSTYGDAGLAKFSSLTVAHQFGTVTIYRASSATGEVPKE